jgi:hypothetical protein
MRIEDDLIVFAGGTKYPILPEVNITQIKTSTTPNVQHVQFIKFSNSAPVSVTNFVGGAPGQMIRCLGDGNTTIVNGTTIKTNTGANKLLASTKVYTFSHYLGVWYENE